MNFSLRRHVPAWMLVAAAVLAAWFPLVRPYLRMGDDFHFAGWLHTGGIPLYFQENGVWRILGHETGNAATLAHPLLQGILVLATHGVASLLFLAVLRRLLSSESLAVLLAVIFAAFPWGATVLFWACEYTYLLATTFFLAVLCLLLRVFPLRSGPAAALCVLGTAMSLFSHEALFFAFLIAGGFVFLREEGYSLRQRLALAAAPAIGCGIWAVLYKIYPGRTPPEHIRINPRTLLSGVYYQYTNWVIFEPWKNGSTRELLFFDWTPGQFAAGLVLLCALGWCAWRWRTPPGRGARREIAPDNAMLLFLLALVVGAVAIYALGGGFSLDSRKKYPVVPLVLMFLGCGLARFRPKIRIPHGVILAVAICGTLTAWLQAGLWRYEARRLDALTDFLCAQPQPDRVRVEWDGRIQAAWPRAGQYWGAPVEQWVLDDAVRLRGMLAPRATDARGASPAAAVKFDPDRFQWVPAG